MFVLRLSYVKYVHNKLVLNISEFYLKRLFDKDYGWFLTEP